METLEFKTNIKCSGCVEIVKPFLNEDHSIEKWQVDLLSPEKRLKVQTSHSASEIAELMKKAGYNAEEIA